MTEEKKKQLFPYFAYLYSQQLNPEKYGNTESIEEWTSLIQESPEDIEEITSAASSLSDDDWAEIETQYNEEQSSDEVEMAKKGAKLKKLQEFKKGAKMGKKKKCACGCDLITKKEKGGTLVDECTCCGEVHKFQGGGVSSWRTVTNYGGSEGDPRFLNFISRIFSRKNTSKSSGNTSVKQKPQTQWERNARTYSQEEIRNMPGYEPTVNPTPGTTRTQPTGGASGAPQRVTTQSGGLTSTSSTVKTPSRNNAGGVPKQSPNQGGNRNTSVVDYLNSTGENSSFNDRKQLASVLGIQNYRGSSTQNIQLLNLLKEGKGSLGALKQNLVHNPVIAPISEVELASIQSKRVPTTVAANRKGGLIKKAQKGTKTKEEYLGNHETWDPKSVGTGDNSMNPKDWSPEKKKADREAWLNRNKKVTKKPVPSKKEVGLPKKK